MADPRGPYSKCTNLLGRKLCGGHVDWENLGDRWRGTCRSCRDQRRAASGEAAKLDAWTQSSNSTSG